MWFLLQVNHQNVVKMGHRQVVNMIKHGGNRIVIKVVTVSRNPEQDNKTRKKGTKRLLHMCSQDKWRKDTACFEMPSQIFKPSGFWKQLPKDKK